MRRRFGPDRRLHARREFTRAYDTGQKVHGRYVTVFLFATDRPVCRLGVTATRKFGDAVRRNLAKRRLREIFRTSDLPPGLDVVIVPKREFFDASHAALQADVRGALARYEPGGRPRRPRGPRGHHRPAGRAGGA